MTKNDRGKFVEAFFGMEEYFGKNHSKTIIEIYFKSLQDLTIDEFQEACIKAIQRCRFFPKIIELREFADDNASKDMPLLAWLAFREAIKTIGTEVFVAKQSSNSVIPRVIRMLGGMDRIRMWTENELPFRQKDFLEYYNLASRHDYVELISFMPKKNSESRNLIPPDSTKDNETKSRKIPNDRYFSVFQKIEIKTVKSPDTHRHHIKKLIRHLIHKGEDVSSLKEDHPELYADVINENKEG